MTGTSRTTSFVASRTGRLVLVAVGIAIGLGVFAYTRKLGPFETRRESPQIAAVIDGGYKTHQAFHVALRHLQANPTVVAALGQPFAETGLQRYQPILQSAGTRHDYVIDLEGPNGEGVATVSVEELAGRYKLVRAEFTDADGKPHDVAVAN